jgi:hypothetical protein
MNHITYSVSEKYLVNNSQDSQNHTQDFRYTKQV